MKDLDIALPRPCGEAWEGMTPAGCNRLCAACDTVIHDLAAMTVEEAEQLLATPGGACVRAQIGPDGVVRTRNPATSRRIRAMVGGAMALAVAACQTTSVTPLFELTGQSHRGQRVELFSNGVMLETAQTDRSGRFVFHNLPAGTYALVTVNSEGCEGVATENRIEGIELTGADVDLGRTSELFDKCPLIIVGVMSPLAPTTGRG